MSDLDLPADLVEDMTLREIAATVDHLHAVVDRILAVLEGVEPSEDGR